MITDDMRLRMLEGARTLMRKSFEMIDDFDLEVQTFNAAQLLERAAVRDDCECKPGYPVCPSCIEMADILYGKTIPF
jgi:hypothetical protein